MAGICHVKTAILSHPRAATVLQLLHLVTNRAYGTFAAAAQPQLDNFYQDYIQKSDSESKSLSDRLSSTPMVGSMGSVPLRGVHWVFIGNPAAKKHVYAEKLSKLLEVPHISMGSLVRQDLSPRSALYKQIANAVNQGKLVPEDIIFGLLSKRLEDGYYNGETGFILDGIPRSPSQAEILETLIDIDLVVNFKCTQDCLMEPQRDSIYSHSQQSDYFSNSASSAIDTVSQDTQSKHLLHETGSSCNRKANFCAKQFKPLEDYYKRRMKLIDFQVSGAPTETWQELLSALGLRHINASDSSSTTGSSFWM